MIIDFPRNEYAERALLGAILINNLVFEKICETVNAGDFYFQEHIEIFESISKKIMGGGIADPVTIRGGFSDELKNYVVELAAQATTIINGPDYAKAIKEESEKRKALTISRAIENNLEMKMSAEIVLGDIEKGIHEIRMNSVDKPETFKDIIDEAILRVEKAHQGVRVGISTGIGELDRKMLLEPSRLYILAGRPGMGKSTLATQIAMNVALNGHGVAFFNLEMEGAEQAQRMLSRMTYCLENPIPYFDMARGDMDPEKIRRIVRAGEEMKELPFELDGTSSLSIDGILSRSKRIKRKFEKTGKKLSLIVIDYLQLIDPGSRYKGSKVNEVSEISRALKLLSKDLKVPVVCLSQLNRSVEARENKHPFLSDLRDSGSLEQDADTVIFAYRHEYYLSKEEPEGINEREMWLEEMDGCANLMEIDIAKQRGGPTGKICCYCNLASNVVSDLMR